MTSNQKPDTELDIADYSVIASLIDFYLSETEDSPHEFDLLVKRLQKKIDVLDTPLTGG